MNDKNGKEENKNEDRPVVVRNTTDLQRLKLEKLMKNPDKPVIIPEKPKTRSMPPVPDFVRNVMGSSAGAGSGEFHVYRHLRRKEYARQKFIHEKSERERLDEEYHERIADNKRKADEKTAKKRTKRLKRKQKAKQKGKMKTELKAETPSESSDDEDSDQEENVPDTKKSNDEEVNKKEVSQEHILEEKSETQETSKSEDCKVSENPDDQENQQENKILNIGNENNYNIVVDKDT